jgi:hypothetical protein
MFFIRDQYELNSDNAEDSQAWETVLGAYSFLTEGSLPEKSSYGSEPVFSWPIAVTALAA